MGGGSNEVLRPLVGIGSASGAEMDDERWKRLEDLAARQAGWVTRQQALAVGYCGTTWRRTVAARSVRQVERGLYPIQPSRRGEWRDLRGALLLVGDDAVISHRAAARVHGLWGVDGFPIEVTVPRRVRFSLPTMTTYEAEVDSEDRTEVDGLPVTTRVRTLLDLAPRLDCVSWAAMLESARKAQANVVDEVVRRIEGAGIPVDVQRALSVILADCDGRKRPMDSAFEVQFWHRWPYTGLPMPVPQYEVSHRNTKLYIDFAWPAEKVAVETMGYGPRYAKDSFENDSQRTALLVRLGWKVIPVTYSMFREDFYGGVTGAVADALTQRAGLALKK